MGIELQVFEYVLGSVDSLDPERHGAPAGLIAEELGLRTADVTRVAKKLAKAGLLHDTGYAMRRERVGRGYNWQFIERPKTETGMLSKPGASTDWAIPRSIADRIEAGETPAEILRSVGFTANTANAYWVWYVGPDNLPLDEGPFGPYSRESAVAYARIGAGHGARARAVSYGRDPEAPGFRVLEVYRPGSA